MPTKALPQSVATGRNADGSPHTVTYVYREDVPAIRLILTDDWYKVPDEVSPDHLALSRNLLTYQRGWPDQPEYWPIVDNPVTEFEAAGIYGYAGDDPPPASDAASPLSLADTLEDLQSLPRHLDAALPDTVLADLDLCDGGQRLAAAIEDAAIFIRDLCEQIADRGFDTTKPVSQ